MTVAYPPLGEGEPRRFDPAAVRWVFDHRPLTADVVRALNPGRSPAELAGEIRHIGYGSDRD